MRRGFFVAGTDTGVGKTLVSCALLQAASAAGWRAAGMKPVAAGCRDTPAGLRNDDAEALLAAGNVPSDYDDTNPVAMRQATSPELAARADGITIRIGEIVTAFNRLAGRTDLLVVEGAGGWYAPIGPHETMADVAQALDLPVLLVVGMRIGCLNHAQLTVEAIARSGLPLAGIVANGTSDGRLDPGYAESLASRAAGTPVIMIPRDRALAMGHAVVALAAFVRNIG